LKLAPSAIHSILDVRNLLKQADVLTASTKNTALRTRNSNNEKKTGKRTFTCLFFISKKMTLLDAAT
jgi:hypothetical protein